MNHSTKLPPIYTKAYNFQISLFKTSAKFPKYYRTTLGQRLETTSLDLTIKIRTVLKKQSGTQLKQLLSHIDGIKVMLQTCFDLGIIGVGRFSVLSEEVSEIGSTLLSFEGK